MQQQYGKEASGFERMEKIATHELTRTFRNFTYMQTKFVDPLKSVKLKDNDHSLNITFLNLLPENWSLKKSDIFAEIWNRKRCKPNWQKREYWPLFVQNDSPKTHSFHFQSCFSPVLDFQSCFSNFISSNLTSFTTSEFTTTELTSVVYFTLR